MDPVILAQYLARFPEAERHARLRDVPAVVLTKQAAAYAFGAAHATPDAAGITPLAHCGLALAVLDRQLHGETKTASAAEFEAKLTGDELETLQRIKRWKLLRLPEETNDGAATAPMRD